MIKDKQGKEYTFKEFTTKWKKGISGITPLQQVKSQISGTYLMIIGLLCGVVVLAFSFKKNWWVEIILVAGLFNTCIQLIGLKQKRNVLKQFNLAAIDVESILKQQEVIDGS